MDLFQNRFFFIKIEKWQFLFWRRWINWSNQIFHSVELVKVANFDLSRKFESFSIQINWLTWFSNFTSTIFSKIKILNVSTFLNWKLKGQRVTALRKPGQNIAPMRFLWTPEAHIRLKWTKLNSRVKLILVFWTNSRGYAFGTVWKTKGQKFS